MIYSFVLCHPEVTFTIKWDEKEKEILKLSQKIMPAKESLRFFSEEKLKLRISSSQKKLMITIE